VVGHGSGRRGRSDQPAPTTPVKPIPVEFHVPLGFAHLTVHTYGIGLAITFWFAFRYFERRLRRNGYPWQWLTGVFLWVVVAAIVGARVVHVVANFSQYWADPIQVFAIWNGGLSSFGGLLFGVPTGVVLARRRCPQLPTVRALDLVSPVLMAAWGVGRLLGPQLMVNGGGHPTTQWFGMRYACTGLPPYCVNGTTPRELPVPIFQSIESFVIFGILLLIERRFARRPQGFVLAAAMALWGLERFVEQHLWLSDRASTAGGIAVQVAGLALFAAGTAAMAVLWRHRSSATERTGPEPDTATADGPPRPTSAPRPDGAAATTEPSDAGSPGGTGPQPAGIEPPGTGPRLSPRV